MSWELDNTEYKTCPCNKGKIRIDHFSDDWNRYNTEYTIECELCKNEYHIEFQSSYKPFRGTSAFLVKNGETTQFNVQANSFEESMVQNFTKEELMVLYEKMTAITSSTSVNRNIVKEHKRWYKTVKMNMIRVHIRDAINRYDAFMYNKTTLELKREECDKVKRFYI